MVVSTKVLVAVEILIVNLISVVLIVISIVVVLPVVNLVTTIVALPVIVLVVDHLTRGPYLRWVLILLKLCLQFYWVFK